ncbi:IS21 family transposase [Flexivirga caeni]|uniref:IS21 family transposase n=1 Tax=Flexivirga caeni TaxID=2294115 RepID=A0A3M9LWA2_9MICO|nr:IS21 family transposase [Flexivirga caeni]RNI16618.1 IS21 family transposase [Flexivirga caeni]
MKSAEEIMNMLEAFDLTGSLRDAGELSGVSHHTVAKYVAARDAGALPDRPVARPQLIDEFLPKVEEWIDRSQGKLRADVAHDKLVALGYTGSERTTRRAVAAVKKNYRLGRVRVHRPWVTEPGMWLQYDFGDGPLIDGIRTTLFVAWLAWSRFRVVLAIRDKTAPSVMAALDVTLRRIGGTPTYLLTDNEKTVTVEHVAGIPVRNAGIVEFSRHYGLTVHTCVPCDPASKGGSESSVKIAKADLVPKDTNLLDAYESFADLEAAFCQDVNARVHRVTRRAPTDMLAEEQARLHPVPAVPHTVAFGVTRTVAAKTPMVAFEGGQYSVPAGLLAQTVWVRVHGRGADEQVVIVHVGDQGPIEVARHARATPGSPKIDDAHFPPAPAGALDRKPLARNESEAAFLAIGNGARLWLTEAAAAGTTKIRVKMAQAVALAKLFDAKDVDWALGHAAVHARFAEGDLASILDHHKSLTASGPTSRAGEGHSLTQGTAGWAALGVITPQLPLLDGDDDTVVTA